MAILKREKTNNELLTEISATLSTILKQQEKSVFSKTSNNREKTEKQEDKEDNKENSSSMVSKLLGGKGSSEQYQKKELGERLKSLAEGIKALSSSIIEFYRIRKKIKFFKNEIESLGIALEGFYNKLKDIDEDQQNALKTFTESLSKFIDTLNKIGLSTIIFSGLFFKFILNEKIATQIVNFMKILSSIDGSALATVNETFKGLSDIITSLSNAMLKMVACIAIMALLLKFDIGATVGATLIVVALFAGLIVALIQLANRVSQDAKSLDAATNAIRAVTISLLIAVGSITILSIAINKIGFKNIILAVITAGAVMAGLVGIIKLLVIATKGVNPRRLMTAVTLISTITGVFTIISLICAFILPQIAKQDTLDILKGLGIVAIVMVALVGFVTYMSIIAGVLAVIPGGVAGLWGVVALLGIGIAIMLLIPTIVKGALKAIYLVKDTKWSVIGEGLGKIATLLIGLGVVFTIAGALAAIGGAVGLIGFGLIFIDILIIKQILKQIPKLIDLANEINIEDLSKVGEVLNSVSMLVYNSANGNTNNEQKFGVIGGFFINLLGKAFGDFATTFATAGATFAFLLVGIIKLGLILVTILIMKKTIKEIGNLITYSKRISSSDINEFKTNLLGQDGTGGLFGVISEITKRIEEVIPSGAGEFLKGFIGQNFNQKLFTISRIEKVLDKFMSLVFKAATLTYSETDEKGNIIIKKLSQDDFSKAAETVGTGFNDFITGLNDAFKGISPQTARIIEMLDNNIDNLVDTLAKFVKIVVSIADLKFVSEYDKNGKPLKWQRYSASDFKDAATQISEGFKTFITGLNEGFKGIDEDTADIIEMLDNNIDNLVDTLAKFVKIVVDMTSTGIPVEWDKDGKPIKFVEIKNSSFLLSATRITMAFKDFLVGLNKGFSDISPQTQETIKNLSKSISPITDALAKFVDAVLSYTSMKILKGFAKDKDGNETIPLYRVATQKEFTDSGKKIIDSFLTFLTSLNDAIEANNLEELSKDAVKKLGNALDPIMKVIGSYLDVIQKLNTPGLSFKVKGVDENGKPIYDFSQSGKLDPAEVGSKLASGFIDFIGQFIDYFSNNEDIIKDAADQIKNIDKISDSVFKLIGNLISSISKALVKTDKDSDSLYTYTSAVVGSFVGIYKFIINTISSEDFTSKIDILSGQVSQYSNASELINQFIDNLFKIGDKVKANKDINIQDVAKYFTSAIAQFAKMDLPKNVNNIRNAVSTYNNVMASFIRRTEIVNARLLSENIQLKKATKNFQDLDNELLKKRKQRNAALKEFTDGINNINIALENVNTTLEKISNYDLNGQIESLNNKSNKENTNKSSSNNKQTNNTSNNTQETNKKAQQNIKNNKETKETSSTTNNTSNNYSFGNSTRTVIFKFPDNKIIRAFSEGL